MSRRWRPGRQTPRVVDGAVQKKQRRDVLVSEHELRDSDDEPLPIVTLPALRGWRHVVDESELARFVRLIPDWDERSLGLRALILGEGGDGTYGWHDERGVICLNAWGTPFEETWSRDDHDELRPILERLQVDVEIDGADAHCRFTRKTAGGFLLMYVFLHELGHHVDRMGTRYQEDCPGGEPFAEDFAATVADSMWDRFFREFGW